MALDIKDLQRRLRAFAAARDWQSFHSPKNLAMALMVEAAELLELFQWLTTAESNTLTRDAADKERVADELADVLLYLLQLADHTGVDLEAAAEIKLRKNAVKHLPKHVQTPEQLQPVLVPPVPPLAMADGKVHLLIDWENVQPKDADLQALAPHGTHAWIFHGPQQRVDAQWHAAYGGRVTHVPIARPGKNALDFHLSYYIGYITARQPSATFIVISNDKGYDPMLEHSRDLGFLTTRREFRPTPKVPTSPVKLPVVPTVKSTVQQPACKAMPKAKATTKPVTTSAPAKKAAAIKSAVQKAVAGQTKASSKTVPRKPAPAQKVPPAKTSPAKKSPLTEAQIAQRVIASLSKMTTNKPAKKSALLKTIKSHAGQGRNADATADLVLSLLQKQGVVMVSGEATAVSYPQSA